MKIKLVETRQVNEMAAQTSPMGFNSQGDMLLAKPMAAAIDSLIASAARDNNVAIFLNDLRTYVPQGVIDFFETLKKYPEILDTGCVLEDGDVKHTTFEKSRIVTQSTRHKYTVPELAEKAKSKILIREDITEERKEELCDAIDKLAEENGPWEQVFNLAKEFQSKCAGTKVLSSSGNLSQGNWNGIGPAIAFSFYLREVAGEKSNDLKPLLKNPSLDEIIDNRVGQEKKGKNPERVEKYNNFDDGRNLNFSVAYSKAYFDADKNEIIYDDKIFPVRNSRRRFLDDLVDVADKFKREDADKLNAYKIFYFDRGSVNSSDERDVYYEDGELKFGEWEDSKRKKLKADSEIAKKEKEEKERELAKIKYSAVTQDLDTNEKVVPGTPCSSRNELIEVIRKYIDTGKAQEDGAVAILMFRGEEDDYKNGDKIGEIYFDDFPDSETFGKWLDSESLKLSRYGRIHVSDLNLGLDEDDEDEEDEDDDEDEEKNESLRINKKRTLREQKERRYNQLIREARRLAKQLRD